MEQLRIGIVFDNTGISRKRKTPSVTGRENVERESILDTVKAVEEVLTAEKHDIAQFPVDYPLRTFVKNLNAGKVDLVFNLCDGVDDKSYLEPCVAGLFDLLALRYTGSDPQTLAVTLSKQRTKALLAAQGLRTPGYFMAHSSRRSGMRDGLSFPLIVKPSSEDASIGISLDSVVQTEGALQKRIRFVLKNFQQPALVEEYIDGREVSVSVVGNKEPIALSISEIDFSTMPEGLPRIVTYRGKWLTNCVEFASTVPICPAKLEEKLSAEIKRMAVAAYMTTGCRDYARVDFRLKDRETPYILEVNANPDLSPGAGLARSACAYGWEYRDLVLSIAEFAVERPRTDLLLPEEVYGN